ncbi:unnamed protein product, partial [Hapterophycus canaliculatus]
MPKPKYDHPVIKKGAVQVFAHLAQKPMSAALKKNLNTMLIKTPDLIEAMIELACSRRWLQTTIFVIDFSQCVVQGLWLNDHDLRQLPHIGEAEAKAICSTPVPGKPHIKGIAQYIKLPREERKGLDQLSAKQQDEVHRVCSIIPDVTVQVDIFVEDEGEIAENDLVTIKVTLTRNNVPEGAKVPPVYAPKYPLFADEGWWVLVGDVNRKTIFSFERITDNGRVVSKEVRVV